MAHIRSFKELRVWQNAMDGAMAVFELTKKFPHEEKYSMTDQIRRSSRSVAANIAEAWRKRRYQAAFVSKLSDSEAEASETQTWIELARRCRYLNDKQADDLDQSYEQILGQLVSMINQPESWIVGANRTPRVPASPHPHLSENQQTNSKPNTSDQQKD